MDRLLLQTDAARPLSQLLQQQLEQVTIIFERQLASDVSAVNRLCLHIEHYRGKMLRPMLVLLFGLVEEQRPEQSHTLSDSHRTLAAVVEMIHMATLVHDDVLDESAIRRQGATINRLWGNETAVMLGDYLISNAFHLCSTLGEPAINESIGKVTNTLCEGELLQLSRRNDWSIDQATYMEIVQRKTASLVGECCRLGMLLSGGREDLVNAAKLIGIKLGIAFQIQDDLLDLVGDEAIAGKSLGQDLKKGKLTLPLIHLLHESSAEIRCTVLEMIEQRAAADLRGVLLESSAIEETRTIASGLVDEARAILDSFPSTPGTEMLHTLAGAIIHRQF